MADFQLEAPGDEPVMGMPGGSPPVTEQPPPVYEPTPGEEPPPPVEEPPAEGEDEEPDPRPKRTVVGDLVQERERRQRAETEAEQAQALIRTVLETPGGFEVLQRAATGAPAPTEQAAEQEALRQELEATAIDLGLYDADGNPDLKTAHRITQREERRLTKLVEQAVAPLRQQTQAQTANQIIAHVKQVAQHYGIDPEMVERGMRTLPPDQMGNPEVQQTVLMTALGLQTFGGQPGQVAPQRPRGQLAQQPAPPGMRAALRPPVYSEPAGGRPRGQAPVLDQSFRDRLRGSGLKDAEIDRAVSNFVPGTPMPLE